MAPRWPAVCAPRVGVWPPRQRGASPPSPAGSTAADAARPGCHGAPPSGPLPVRLLLLAPLSSKSSEAAPPEYQMPSVTWGVIQGRKERLVSRVLALDFLRSAGVS